MTSGWRRGIAVLAAAWWCAGAVLARAQVAGAAPTVGGGRVAVTNELEYSYGTATRLEIVEDWLDLSWSQGDLRAGLLFDHQAPGEEGGRVSEVRHRFVEFSTHGVDVRAGHFYGLFGRGLCSPRARTGASASTPRSTG